MNLFAHDPFGPNAKCQVDPQLTQQQLVDYVNTNSAKMHGWKSTSATISGTGLPVPLKSTIIAVEGPRNFRLLANKPFTGGRAADLGSNDNRFWFWFADEKQPEVIMCNHEDVGAVGRAMPIPFEPDWLMDVMGVRQLIVDENAFMVERDGFVEINSKRVSPSGQPVTKRTTVSRCHGIVVEHALLDAGGRIIAQAKLSQHVRDAATGAVLPTRIELSWPQAQMDMSIQLEQVQINPTSSPIQFQVPQGMPVRQIPPQGMVRRSTIPENSYENSSAQGDFQQLDAAPYDGP